jgi:hypothetical protein
VRFKGLSEAWLKGVFEILDNEVDHLSRKLSLLREMCPPMSCSNAVRLCCLNAATSAAVILTLRCRHDTVAIVIWANWGMVSPLSCIPGTASNKTGPDCRHGALVCRA